jgi:hypothetical protein
MAEILDTSSDYVIDYQGFESWRCPLCGDFADNDFGHPECFNDEEAWAAAAGEYAAENEAWRYLNEVW